MVALVSFMSSPWGRGLRVIAGLGLITLAVVGGGWGWLLVLPGVFMLASGALNYCPAASFAPTPENRSEFMASLGPRNLLK